MPAGAAAELVAEYLGRKAGDALELPVEIRQVVEAGLERRAEEIRSENAGLQQRLVELEQRQAALDAKRAEQDRELAELKARLDALETARDD